MLAQGWFGVVAALLVACGGRAESSPTPTTGGHAGSPTTDGDAGSPATGATSLSACDPLAANTTAVKLDASQVVAAGQAKDGTLYVVYGDNRLFVGSGKQLEERVVTGSGETGTQTILDYTDDDGTPATVQVTRDASGTQIAVAHGQQMGKGIDKGSGEVLTPVDASLVATLAVTTTQSFQIDFAASLPDGRELVVVAPEHDFSYDHFRVFFGPPTALAQRVVTNFGSSQSGKRSASVVIDGAAADLTYLAGGPSQLNPTPGPSIITVAGTTYPLIEGPVPPSASYLCFSQ